MARSSISRRAPTMPTPIPVDGLERAAQHGVQVRDAGATILDQHAQLLRPRLEIEVEPDSAAAGVAEGVANDFRDRGGNSRLVLGVELEQGCQLRRTSPRGDHVFVAL